MFLCDPKKKSFFYNKQIFLEEKKNQKKTKDPRLRQ